MLDNQYRTEQTRISKWSNQDQKRSLEVLDTVWCTEDPTRVLHRQSGVKIQN